MQQQKKIIRLLSDLLIPVLGFYFWDWNLYFILLFFCLDMVAGEITLFLKAKKIAAFQADPQIRNGRVFGIISLLLLSLNIVFIHLGVFAINEGFAFKKEVISFLAYEEMGIKQGYILLPLIGLMAFSQYYSEFLVVKKYEFIRYKELFKRNFQLKFAILIFTTLLSLVAVGLALKEEVLLWSMLIPISFVNWVNAD